MPGLGLLQAVERSFPAPELKSKAGVLRDEAWIGRTADGVVEASIALYVSAPGFREAAAVLVARGAWAADARGGGGPAIAAARDFVRETRDWAVRRGRLDASFGGDSSSAPVPDRPRFLAALQEAAAREAVHSFGVVHALAAALADLHAGGSEQVACAAARALLASRPTWSPGRPARGEPAPASDGGD
jgi:hypothetical protein